MNQLREVIKSETEPIKKEMATKKDIEALEKKIEDGHMQILETITRTADEIIQQQEPRFSQIEDALEIPHPKKN